MSSEYKNPDFPAGKLVLIIVSFLLGLLDMNLLSTAIQPLMGFNRGTAMMTAFLIATIANFMALTWGLEDGKNMSKKMCTKSSIVGFLMWMAIGFIYAGIRIANIAIHKDDVIVSGEIVTMIFLAISYISTGFLIHNSMRDISWADAVALRKARSKFEEYHEVIAEDGARINEALGILARYQIHYESLDAQRNKIESAISKAERATMSTIVSRMLTINTDISPAAAQKVMDDVLKNR